MKFVVKNGLAEPGDRILVGVSGGADSVALLLVLHELSLRLSFTVRVAHLNHGLRGEEADLDSRFVKDLCHKLGVDCECGYVSIPKLLEGKSVSMQDVARQERFRFFSAAMQRFGLNKLALAHHQDDQAETVLLRLLRGTGLSGLRAMSPLERGLAGILIVRPFLMVSRQEIEAFLALRGQDYRVDSSNLGTEYSRNYVRLSVMPLLRQINPQVAVALYRLSSQVAQDVDYMSIQALPICAAAISALDFGVGVRLEALMGVHAALVMRVLTEAYFRVATVRKDLETIHLAETFALLDKQVGRRITLPAGVRVLRTREHLVFYSATEENQENYHLTISVPGEYNLPCGGKLVARRVTECSANQPGDFGYAACLSYSGDLVVVRNRRPHDAYILLGGVGRKKVKQAMSEARIPLPWRDTWPIIEIEGQIAWVPGLRVANAFCPKEQNTILELFYQRGGK